MKQDTAWMQEALNLAKTYAQTTRPNPAVGCVIVKNGQIVGRGAHKKAGGPHAEVYALHEAKEFAQGATLFVTLEPCNHTGRTPPCTEAILQAGIKHVVIAQKDPNPKVSGAGIERLQKAGLDVEVGLLSEKARILNEIYLWGYENDVPYFILKWAMSLDGKSATSSGQSQWLTADITRQHAHAWRDRVDAIMIGSGTVQADRPHLTVRLPEKNEIPPVRILLDTHFQIAHDQPLMQPDAPTWIFTHTLPQKAMPTHVRLYQTPLDATGKLDLRYVAHTLNQEGIHSVLVEGGPTLLFSLIEARLVQKVITYIAPLVIGGDGRFGAVTGSGFTHLQDALQLSLQKWQAIGPDLYVEGSVHVHRPD